MFSGLQKSYAGERQSQTDILHSQLSKMFQVKLYDRFILISLAIVFGVFISHNLGVRGEETVQLGCYMLQNVTQELNFTTFLKFSFLFLASLFKMSKQN